MNTSTALWVRTYLSAAGSRGLAVMNSTAWPGLSQLRCMPAQASRARSASAWVRGPACRLATRMTIEDMGATGRTEHGARASERLAVIIAGPTASGKSALGPGAGATAGRHGDQCRRHAMLSRAAHRHRPPLAGGRGVWSRTASMACAQRAGAGQCRLVAAGGAGGDGSLRSADSMRRHGDVFFRAGERHRRGAGGAGSGAGRGQAAAGRAGRGCGACQARPGNGGAAETGRQPARLPRL